MARLLITIEDGLVSTVAVEGLPEGLVLELVQLDYDTEGSDPEEDPSILDIEGRLAFVSVGTVGPMHVGAAATARSTRARLADGGGLSMSRKPFPYNAPVNSRYGAPMGRSNVGGTDDTPIVLTLRLVPFHDGDYDPGGAYWGSPANLWCAWSPDRSVIQYVRARSKDVAEAMIREAVSLEATFRS